MTIDVAYVPIIVGVSVLILVVAMMAAYWWSRR